MARTQNEEAAYDLEIRERGNLAWWKPGWKRPPQGVSAEAWRARERERRREEENRKQGEQPRTIEA
jgi:hypothetical protein